MLDCYRITGVLGIGGFGITYRAEDTGLATQVALKEYYPSDFGDRDARMRVRPRSERHKPAFEWGLSSFLQEARTLAQFSHPGIVRVIRVFEANSTAYMVMNFEEGQSLESWLKHLGSPPPQDMLDRIAIQLLDALETLHAVDLLHRDIAPDNILVRADGSPVLLDFGAARRAVGEASRALTGIVKAGYSPQEQYTTDSRLQGPWTDLYALGGTLYRAVTGRTPEESTLRAIEDRMPPAVAAASGPYRPTFLAAIDACLRTRLEDRPQSVAELRPMLLLDRPANARAKEEAGRARPYSASRAHPGAVAADRVGRRRWIVAASALLVGVGVVLGGYEYGRRQSEQRRVENADAARKLESARVWETLKDTSDTTVLQAFIRQYGGTEQGAMAARRLDQLKKQQESAAAPPPRPVLPAPSAPDPRPPAAELSGESAWVKLCETASREGRALSVCLTHHERLDGNTGAVLVSAAIRQVEGSDKQHLMVMVPLGTLQQAGMRAAFYSKAAWARLQRNEKVDETGLKSVKLAYTLCHAAGCTAEIEASPDLIDDLKSGGGMIVYAVNASGKPVGFPVPLSGFAAAYAGLPVDNKKYGDARRALLRQIEMRKQSDRATK
jgi:invasion protein IalB/tRNA A-37 threonylcarbamoyl transferase component Bud32